MTDYHKHFNALIRDLAPRLSLPEGWTGDWERGRYHLDKEYEHGRASLFFGIWFIGYWSMSFNGIKITNIVPYISGERAPRMVGLKRPSKINPDDWSPTPEDLQKKLDTAIERVDEYMAAYAKRMNAEKALRKETETRVGALKPIPKGAGLQVVSPKTLRLIVDLPDAKVEKVFEMLRQMED